MEKEVTAINNVLKNAASVHGYYRRFKGKFQARRNQNLLDKVDNLIIGGGMGYTFIKAQGGKIGKSPMKTT